mgnify:CR=1 FL=1
MAGSLAMHAVILFIIRRFPTYSKEQSNDSIAFCAYHTEDVDHKEGCQLLFPR